MRFAAFLLAFSLAGAVGCDKSTKKGEAGPEKLPRVTAPELFGLYAENAVAGDANYKGKQIEIIGVVQSVGTDATGEPYVLLRGGQGVAVLGVQCLFPRANRSELAGLRAEDAVTARGRCAGKFGNVIVRDCSLTENHGNWELLQKAKKPQD